VKLRSSDGGGETLVAERPGVLVDTSVWIRADRRSEAKTRQHLQSLIAEDRVWTCWPVRAELLIGEKKAERFAILDEQLAALAHAPVTEDAWRLAARVGSDLARTGRTVPMTDLVIAATAIQAGIPLWTVDADFERIASVSPLLLYQSDRVQV
jgi:hypothetical protein